MISVVITVSGDSEHAQPAETVPVWCTALASLPVCGFPPLQCLSSLGKQVTLGADSKPMEANGKTTIGVQEFCIRPQSQAKGKHMDWASTGQFVSHAPL